MKRPVFRLGGRRIRRGETCDLSLPISQTSSGAEVTVPVRVIRAAEAGPVLLLTAAVHGDELNGTGIIRELALDPPALATGTLVLMPVVNLLGFERQARYLPDRRDLNRNFPGSPGGSLARRIAHAIFQGVVQRADYCIDFHTAAVQRTNFPNVRGDLRVQSVRRLADAFGTALVIDSEGPRGSLRRTATESGTPTIIVEAGEVWKIEPVVVEIGLRGVRNVLADLGMVHGQRAEPAYRAEIGDTVWVRADSGGILRFHTRPGSVVDRGDALASCTDLLGRELGRIEAPVAGVVLSVTTLPAITPGEPVCHIAVPRDGIGPIRTATRALSDESLYERVRDGLATSVLVDRDRDASDVS